MLYPYTLCNAATISAATSCNSFCCKDWSACPFKKWRRTETEAGPSGRLHSDEQLDSIDDTAQSCPGLH